MMMMMMMMFFDSLDILLFLALVTDEWANLC